MVLSDDEPPPPPQVAGLDDQTQEEKEEQIPKSSELNERVEKAVARTDKMEKALMAPKKKRLDFQPPLMSVYSVIQGTNSSRWPTIRLFRTSCCPNLLTADKDTLYYRGKDVPFAWLYEGNLHKVQVSGSKSAG